jgi:long-chain fatty acid transport protein
VPRLFLKLNIDKIPSHFEDRESVNYWSLSPHYGRCKRSYNREGSRMKRIKSIASVVATAMLIIYSGDVFGTVGYFPTGYGTRSLGMGGTATANPQDSMVIATNPAGISFLESRFDAGLLIFSPIRGYTCTQQGNDPTPIDMNSQRDIYLIPSFSTNYALDCMNSIGIAVYGRGGMNTTYASDNQIFGGGDINQVMGVDFMQMFITPTYSRAINENHSIGISLVGAVQRIRWKGLQGFQVYSYSPDHVTNRGYDYAGGLGFRLGWMGDFCNQYRFGLAYASRTWCTKFTKYRGLIAAQGNFDVPAEIDAGFCWHPNECFSLAFDYQYIFYSTIRALGHPVQNIGTTLLGTDEGAGFGWKDISVFKVGANYAVNPAWEVRAGYTYGQAVYPSDQVDPNITAPAVTKHHISLGTSYHITCRQALDFAYVYALPGKQKGQSIFGLGEVTQRMYQNILMASYSYLY